MLPNLALCVNTIFNLQKKCFLKIGCKEIEPINGRNKTGGFIAIVTVVSLTMYMLSMNPLKYLCIKFSGKLFFKNLILATTIQCKI